MATDSKTIGTSLLGLQSIAANTVVLGTPLDVSTKLAGMVEVHFGRRSVTAFGTAPIIRVEFAAAATDGFWFLWTQFQPIVGASLTNQAATGTNNAGQNIITMAATTNFAVQDLVYVDNTTIGNSEFFRVKTVTAATSLTFEDNLRNAQNSGAATVYRAAEFYSVPIDLSGIGRVRIVADGSAANQTWACEAFINTLDSFG